MRATAREAVIFILGGITLVGGFVAFVLFATWSNIEGSPMDRLNGVFCLTNCIGNMWIVPGTWSLRNLMGSLSTGLFCGVGVGAPAGFGLWILYRMIRFAVKG